MSNFLLTSVFGLLIGCIFAQDDFKVTVTKIEVVSYDEAVIKDPFVVLFQYNNTHQAFNFSGRLLKDLGMNLIDNADIYSIDHGEAQLMSTAKDVNVCEVLTSGYPELEELFKIGNFTKCPMLKNYYGGNNAIIDLSKVPPSIPRGEFMIDVKSANDGAEFLRSKTYLTVEDVPAKEK